MTLMDQEGQVLRSGRVPNLRAAIEKFLEGGEAMEAVIETGRPSCTMVDFSGNRNGAPGETRTPDPLLRRQLVRLSN